jgi:hypothetical protein
MKAETYYCNVHADGLVTVWLSMQTAAFDRKLAASVGRLVPVMVVAKMKPPLWERLKYH